MKQLFRVSALLLSIWGLNVQMECYFFTFRNFHGDKIRAARTVPEVSQCQQHHYDYGTVLAQFTGFYILYQAILLAICLKQYFDTRYLVFYNTSPPRMFLSLDLL